MEGNRLMRFCGSGSRSRYKYRCFKANLPRNILLEFFINSQPRQKVQIYFFLLMRYCLFKYILIFLEFYKQMNSPIPELIHEESEQPTSNYLIEAQSLIEAAVPSHHTIAIMNIFVVLLVNTRKKMDDALIAISKVQDISQKQQTKQNTSIISSKNSRVSHKSQLSQEKKEIIEDTLKLLESRKNYTATGSDKTILDQISLKIISLEGALVKLSKEISQFAEPIPNTYKVSEPWNGHKQNYGRQVCRERPGLRQKVNIFYQSPPQSKPLYPHYAVNINGQNGLKPRHNPEWVYERAVQKQPQPSEHIENERRGQKKVEDTRRSMKRITIISPPPYKKKP